MTRLPGGPPASDALACDPLGCGPLGPESLPPELHPFRRRDLPNDAEAARLLDQGLARRVIADVLVAFDAPDSPQIRTAAVALLIPDEIRTEHGWVLGFGSAAWLHTGSGPGDKTGPSELQVIIPPGRRRPRAAGVRGRQVALPVKHVMFVGEIAVTDPVRTAADVARDLPAAQALAALRRLGELTGVRPHQVTNVLATMRYARGAANARQLIKTWANEG